MEIHFEGRITRQQFYKAHGLHMRPSQIRIVLRLVAAAIFITAMVRSYMMDPQNWQIQVLLAFPLLVATLPWWMPFLKTSSFNDPKNPLRDPILGIASNVGIAVSGPSFKSSMRWESYSHHRINDEMVLLYQGKRGFNVFPRSLFPSDSAWENFVQLVMTKTPDRFIKPPRKST